MSANSAPTSSLCTEARIWRDDELGPLPVIDTQLLSIGGGLASFALVDVLRVSGARARDIRVVGPHQAPTDSFRQLAGCAQITEDERLRSDSAARIDNVWGFPGYASAESWSRRTLKPLLRVLLEPLGAEYFTPRAAAVYGGTETEAARIGWPRMTIGGQAEVVRPRDGGGYLCLVRTPHGDHLVVRAQFVHLGLGHPALRPAADMARFRDTYGDTFTAVNAYEPHEHVYRRLAHAGGTVVVRGAGITASRVLERLLTLRASTGADIRVVHLVRRPGTGGRPLRGHRRRRYQRAPSQLSAWDYQAFNVPKGALGGQLAAQLAALEEPGARARMSARLAGTTTAPRRAWQEQLRRAEVGGYYRLHVGTVTSLSPTPGLGVRIQIADRPELAASTWIDAAALVDCTGLHRDITAHPLVADLLARDLALLNAAGRLQVDENFEVRQARNGNGRLYATGAVAFGNTVAPVDSFWGLQRGAVAVCDELARHGLGYRLTTARSVRGWYRWTRGRRP